MANIYLIRHCESEGNATRRTQAQADALVTSKGYRQSEYLRRRFKNTPIDSIYSSDAYRSIMTVEPIAKERGLPVNVRIQLREITTGIWEDMAWGNIARDYPDDNRDWQEHPWDNNIPGATSFQQAADRLLFALRRIARDVGDGTALCVSHSCTIKAGLCLMMNRPLSDVTSVGHGDNTSVSLIHVDRDGNFDVEYANDSSHLPEGLGRAWSGVAGADVNMIVDRVDPKTEWPLLLDLAEASFRERNGADAFFDRDAWTAEAQGILAKHPNYLALCRLKNQVTGFVVMDELEDLPNTCGFVKDIYVTQALQGKGYSEQLFGYAAHEFRYGAKQVLVMNRPETEEDHRLVDRFMFHPMAGFDSYTALELFTPPCPYPILV